MVPVEELEARILQYLDWVNEDPVPFRCRYRIESAASDPRDADTALRECLYACRWASIGEVQGKTCHIKARPVHADRMGSGAGSIPKYPSGIAVNRPGRLCGTPPITLIERGRG